MDSVKPQPQSSNVSSGDLATARLIRAAAAAARTAGPIDTPLTVLSDAELNAPILEPAANRWDSRHLHIRGYRVEAEIGTGGQATVYRGTQDATGRNVAIKVISGGPFVSSRRRARFGREATLLAGLDHPNIVGILDRGRTEDGSFFIVMDLIEGVPLDEHWAQIDDPKTLAQLFLKVARAVDEAHQRGVVHRDLKPSNIRVDRRGEPHVLDFGLARMTAADSTDLMHCTITDTGQIVGSLPWSSPEQAKNGEDAIDSRSDVYSMGVMLYQAIARKFPYKIDGSLGDTLKHIATTIPSAPSKALSKADFRIFDGITLRALEKNPVHRYPSARDFGDDLEDYLNGKLTKKPKPRRFVRLSSYHRAMSLTVLCISVACASLMSGKDSKTPSIIAELPRVTDFGGLTFVHIPKGTVVMGSKKSQDGHRADELLHSILIERSFWIGTTVVTQKEFSSLMGFNPSDPKYAGDALPVQRVTWNEAQEFCRRLGLRLGRNCRLPTEAEWEYACRATEPAPFGNGVTLDDVGWWSGNSRHKLHPVAIKRPNFWGLYDMHGGVAEWCFDAYQPYPTSNVANSGIPGAHLDRVVRGGSFLSPEADCRAASRAKAPPETRSSDIGFRVAFDDFATHSNGS
jgi:formylglycine-generating enzyme required for sulfatase activity/predicted Ser/Thr protein kinase